MVVASTSAVGLDPAGLAMNGGPTETIALETSPIMSPAIDAIPFASCTYPSGSLNPCSTSTSLQLTCDQRGEPRPDPEDGGSGNCDIGAFELQVLTPPAFVLKDERPQIARSSKTDADEIDTALTFTENGFPMCTAADDALDGFTLTLEPGSCAHPGGSEFSLLLGPFTADTVNHQAYGTFFLSSGPETVSARIVELPTPPAPGCGQWTLNLEVAGINSSPLGNGPFALVLSNLDGDQRCVDITNAIVGDQIPTPPSHSVRRGVR